MDLKLPRLGEGADSGVVVNVFVKEGDQISRDQAVIELENEKAVATIPSTASGVVTKVLVKPGDKISVGQRILTVREDGAPSAAASAAATAKEPGPEPESEMHEPAAEEEIPKPVAAPVASPSVRRLARELGIDLSRVRGSEAGGRIVLSDVRAYIQRLQKGAERQKTPAIAAAASAKPAAEQIDFAKWGPVTKKALSPLRQVIVRRMRESWSAIPRVTQFDEADFTRINDLRKKFGPAFEAKGVRLTATPMLLKALVATLKSHPIFNASLDEIAEEIVFKDYFHIGIAVDTEQGLIVPVIRDVDKKSALDLARELEVLAQKARDRKVTAEDLQGGTFTVSNQGAIGGAHFTPIINKPQVAILGVGRGAPKPVVHDGKIEIRAMVPLAVSYDHRVIDGAQAARFVVDFRRALEGFGQESLNM